MLVPRDRIRGLLKDTCWHLPITERNSTPAAAMMLPRALELARINVANRPTLRAFEQAHDVAVNAGDMEAASQILAEATMRWEAPLFFGRRVSRSHIRRNGKEQPHDDRSPRFHCQRNLGFRCPGHSFATVATTFLRSNQSRVVFMIRGWSVQDDRAGANQVWITVSNSWRTAWR